MVVGAAVKVTVAVGAGMATVNASALDELVEYSASPE
jgi:hypothetical protein